jgi:hypothetical protein
MTRWLLYTGEMLSAQRAFEIGHSVDHYFDPRIQEGLATALERDAVERSRSS